MISEHVLLCSQTENGAESAGRRYGAESVVVITHAVFTFSAHVLPLHNYSADPGHRDWQIETEAGIGPVSSLRV